MSDYEESRAAAEAAAEAASDFRPRRGSWGCAYFGDAPGGIGGGQPWMSWFATRAELLEFVTQHLAFVYVPRVDVDPFMAAEKVAVEIGEAEGELGGAVGPLNDVLKGIVGIDWIGTLDELLEGDGAFAAALRAQHLDLGRDALDSNEAVPPIAESDLERFIDEAILGYGI